ncbi:NADP-dependent D-sorbitol-6-phosphate dehydrogenase [Sesamum angolense]|uniref:NADP-dependent D-sorbitol-6-phosphate dehydrogenase n=1 Tax=Sesamum angolense TaxID=2727404 RepID=A0AAE1WXQ4_9LAMI|nr:NADP-dependent D-sorbitol-6-phosphate dehydrogenase [Sesamum angolense]
MSSSQKVRASHILIKHEGSGGSPGRTRRAAASPPPQGTRPSPSKTIRDDILSGKSRFEVIIPKSSKVERLEENFLVFDFELTEEDMDLIKTIDRNYRTNQPAKFWA